MGLVGISALKLLEHLKLLFEAVPVLFVEHVALNVLFLDPLAAVMDATFGVGRFGGNRLLLPLLLWPFQRWN